MRFVLALILFGACTLPDSHYHGGADARPAPDAPPAPPDAPEVNAIQLSPASLVVVEGASTVFHVRLAAAPSAPVSVSMFSIGGEVVISPPTLIFDASDYAVEQAVTVTGVHDADAFDSQDVVALRADGMADVDLPVAITDIDVLALQISPPGVITINEGSSATIQVSLTAQPGANVTVAVDTSNSASDVVSPAAITFTPANYAVPQVVTITSPHDANTIDETTTITLSATGLPSDLVQVHNVDSGP
jgi:hypothetical protein